MIERTDDMTNHARVSIDGGLGGPEDLLIISSSDGQPLVGIEVIGDELVVGHWPGGEEWARALVVPIIQQSSEETP